MYTLCVCIHVHCMYSPTSIILQHYAIPQFDLSIRGRLNTYSSAGTLIFTREPTYFYAGAVTITQHTRYRLCVNHRLAILSVLSTVDIDSDVGAVLNG